MTTTVSTQTQHPSLVKSIVAGAIAGLGGGAVFGMMMAMMGMLPMVAMLVGSQDPMIGFVGTWQSAQPSVGRMV